MKTARATRDYGLAPLTIEELASIFGVTPTEVRAWIDGKVVPSAQRWTNWRKAGEKLGLDVPVFSEYLVRLYLLKERGLGTVQAPVPKMPPGVTRSEKRGAARSKQDRRGAKTPGN